jgi:decaprenylphospho-beta-D-erythro-pentofuranosid-2-ulose 2-reductase
MTRIVVLGALSDIAEATCRLYAAEGAHLLLAGRDKSRLLAVAGDLRVRGAAQVEIDAGDLAEMDAEECLSRWSTVLGGTDLVLLAYGALGNQRAFEHDLSAAAKLIDTNFRSAALWCLAAANQLESQKHGTLVVIGSVAGDRGRQSNYLYGATKGGLGILVQGIAHRLAPIGARAMLVKPGFVDTAMTAHIPNKGALWASPEKVAALIKHAASRGGPLVYAPGYWRIIMSIIKCVPSRIFHRTKL